MTAPFRAGDTACLQAVKRLGEKLAQDLDRTEPPSPGHFSGQRNFSCLQFRGLATGGQQRPPFCQTPQEPLPFGA